MGPSAYLGGGLLLSADLPAQIDYLSTAPIDVQALPPDTEPIVHAALSFHSYNLIWFGLLAFVVAILLNWRNSLTGYLVNLVVVGADDLGLMWFLILPGHLTFGDAGLGPVLFVVALVFTSIGVLDRKPASQM